MKPTSEEKKSIKKNGFVLVNPDEPHEFLLDGAKIGWCSEFGPANILLSGAKDSAGKGYMAHLLIREGGALALCTGLEIANKDDGTMKTCGSMSSWMVGENVTIFLDGTTSIISFDRAKCLNFIKELREFVEKDFEASNPDKWKTIDMEGCE